jgi:phenylacetate-CoA ligase
MALEGGILGRADDMVVVRGVNIFPSAVEEVLRSCGGVGEFRVTVESGGGLSEISLEIEPAAGDYSTDLVLRVEAAMRNAFGLRVAVASAPSGSLPRFEAKARRWVRR